MTMGEEMVKKVVKCNAYEQQANRVKKWKKFHVRDLNEKSRLFLL